MPANVVRKPLDFDLDPKRKEKFPFSPSRKSDLRS